MQFKLDGVATLVADPPKFNSSADTDKHPLSDVCDPMLNIVNQVAYTNVLKVLPNQLIKSSRFF